MRNYDKQTLLALNAMCHTCLYHREDCRCNKPTSTTASTKEPSAMTDHELNAAIDLAELKRLKLKRDDEAGLTFHKLSQAEVVATEDCGCIHRTVYRDVVPSTQVDRDPQSTVYCMNCFYAEFPSGDYDSYLEALSLKQARSDWGLSVHDQCKRCGYDKDICRCNA